MTLYMLGHLLVVVVVLFSRAGMKPVALDKLGKWSTLLYKHSK